MLDYAKGMIRICLIYLLCIPPLLAAEEGYRIVHPDGTVEFTDQQTEGAEPITLPEIPTYSTPPSTVKGTESVSAGKVREEEVAREITITSPAMEQTLWFDEAGMTVSVEVTPALSEGEQVVLILDGSEVARGSSGRFSLKEVYRGTHILSAAIIDSQGSVISESPAITFYMRQHSVQQP
jgi:hypothetical protein